MSQIIEVKVPDIGHFDSVDVIELHIKPGDTVHQDDALITLESDKASMDIPSPLAGTVKEVKVKAGDKVSQGTLIALIEEAAGAAIRQSAPAGTSPVVTAVAAAELRPPSKPVEQAPKPVMPQGTPNPMAEHIEFMRGKVPYASPSVRKVARELGADIRRIKGSGPRGRITKEDVQAWVKAEMSKRRTEVVSGSTFLSVPAMPNIDFREFGETEPQALSRIKKISALNLHRNWVSVPHVTQFDEADITDLEEFRKSMQEEAAKRGVKLTLLAFLMKAVVNALRAYPNFNASLSADGNELILKKYFHIGFACDTPDGLVVPVIRNVNKKDVLDIARELGELSAQARERKLKLEEMQGGCFTISSLGGIGGTAFTPIINCPEVAILGVSRASYRPVWDPKSKTFEPRLMLPLALSYDHRVIDGADGARFTGHLRVMLSDVRRLLL